MPKLWAKSVGERGNRVRLYEPRPGGNLMRSVYVNGKENRKSLGHSDRERAVRESYLLLAQLRSDTQAQERGSLTLAALKRRYTESPKHKDKKARTQREDEAKLGRVVEFLGSEREVQTLCESDVRRYVRAQRHGSRKVRNRTIEADLLALTRALNWATREKDGSGKWLLQENPLRGVELPKEKNPRRPVVTEAEFQRLLEVAPKVHPLLRLALVIAEGTGRRLSAWRLLRWEDVDLEKETIRWRAENDKKGYEQVVDVTPAVLEALREARPDSAVGSAWVFPSPSNEAKPCGRHLVDDWLRRAYRLAAERVSELKKTDPNVPEIQPKPGSLWHTFRRKWATERKGYSLADVAAAGGWRSTETLVRSYLVTDPATIRNVVLNPTMRLAS